MFEGRVSAKDGEHTLRVVYSPIFPRAGVHVLDVGKEHRRHQNPKEGNLCLAQWEPDQTGADKVAEAIDLFDLLQQGDAAVRAAEVAAPEPASAWYRYTHHREVLIPEQIIAAAKGDRGTFKIALSRRIPLEDLVQGTLVEVSDITSATGSGQPLSGGPLSVGQQIEGYWVRAQATPPFSLYTFDDWLQWAERQNGKLAYEIERQEKQMKPGGRDAVAFAVVYREEGPYQQYHDQWQICIRCNRNGKREDWVMRPHLLPSDSTFFVRAPFLAGLNGKRVIILGLGAIGSIVAAELARAGVTDFVLADYDDFRPGNVVRHACDLRAFGVPKFQAVADQLLCIRPTAQIAASNRRIGSPPLVPEEYDASEGDVEWLDQRLAEADLLVSSICDPAVDGWVDEAARVHGVPCVFAGAFYGAWGGQVFISQREAACHNCFRESGLYADVPIMPADTEMYLDGCGDPSFPGAGFDTSVLANLAARLSVQGLLGGEGYPKAPHNLISWSSRGPAQGEFPSIRLDTIQGLPGCTVCGCADPEA